MTLAGVPPASSGEPVRPHARVPSLTALTTPARFRLAAIVAIAALAVLGVVGVRTALDRQAAADAVAGEATRRLVGAERLYLALADADAAASTVFLQVGFESPSLRARYLADLDTAGRQLAELSAQSDLSPASLEAIARIAEDLSMYAGQVEAARTNNRLGFPLGAAYLRRASDAMQDSILPAATSVYKDAARQLYDAYEQGTGLGGVAVLATVIGAALLLLVAIQVMVALRTRRLLNLGLVAATFLVAMLAVELLASLNAQRRTLTRSQRVGADQLITLSTARILALRSLSDVNLHLIERGTEPAYLEDFARVREDIGGTDGEGGLLGRAVVLAEQAGRSGVLEESIQKRWADYLAVHDRMRQLDDAGDYGGAVEVAVGGESQAAVDVDKTLERSMRSARTRLDENAATAYRHIRWLGLIVVAACTLAALLVAAGLWLRVREFR